MFVPVMSKMMSDAPDKGQEAGRPYVGRAYVRGYGYVHAHELPENMRDQHAIAVESHPLELTVEEAEFLLRVNAHSDGIHRELSKNDPNYMTKRELVRHNKKALRIQEKLKAFISDQKKNDESDDK